MKHVYQHPHFKKWGMYSALMVALGFTVSMNPEHFNNIARHQVDTFSADFATNAPEQINVYNTKQVPNFLSKDGRKYTAEIVDYGDKRVVRFVLDRSETEAQGASCSLCARTYPVAANLTDTEALGKELLATFSDAQNESPIETAVADKRSESHQYLEEWAKPCLGLKDSLDKMSCHTDRLVELSKHLEDTSEKGLHVVRYFQKYLKSHLRNAFSASFYSTMPTSLGGIISNEKALERNEKANDIYERIISELQPENGERTRKEMWSVYRGAYGKQAEHSLNMIKEGFRTGNTQMFQLGTISLRGLKGELDTLTGITMGHLADIGSENSMEELYLSTLYNPVSQHLQGIYSAKDLLNYQLPPLSEGYVMTASTGLPSVDESMIGVKKLEEIMADRARLIRGQNANLQQPNVPTQQGIYISTTTGQMVPTVASPMMQNPNFPPNAFHGTSPFLNQQSPFQQGPGAPIPAGQVPSPFQRGAGR